MARIKTVYVPIWQEHRIVHTATITSDWTPGDYDALRTMFPGGYMRVASGYRGLSYLGDAFHCASFKHFSKWIFV